jgi:hypothetical protein
MEPIVERIVLSVLSAAAQATLMPIGRRIVAGDMGKGDGC